MNIEKLQARLAEVKLAQAKHQFMVTKLVGTIRATKDQNCERYKKACFELNKANSDHLFTLEERYQLDHLISQANAEEKAKREQAAEIRQIVCALISNDRIAYDDLTEIVAEAIEINTQINAQV